MNVLSLYKDLVKIAVGFLFIITVVGFGFITKNFLIIFILIAGILLLVRKKPFKYFYHFLSALFLLSYLIDIYILNNYEAFPLDFLLPIFFVYCGFRLAVKPFKTEAIFEEWVFLAVGGFFSSLLKAIAVANSILKGGIDRLPKEDIFFLFVSFFVILIAAIIFYFYTRKPAEFVSMLKSKIRPTSIAFALLALLMGTWFFWVSIKYGFHELTYQLIAVSVIYAAACLKTGFVTGNKNIGALFLLMGNAFGLLVMVFWTAALQQLAIPFVLITTPLYIFVFIGIFAAMSLASSKTYLATPELG